MIGQLPILTDRQLSLLAYLYKYLNENRYKLTKITNHAKKFF